MSNEISNIHDIPAITGDNTAAGFGVFGKSDKGTGVHGENEGGNVAPDRGVGVWGESQRGFGVFGSSNSGFGVAGVNAINGTSSVGDIRLTGQDCAEDFDATSSIEPGTVVVINDGGILEPSIQAYDRRVAGVVSGAGDFKPALMLGQKQPGANRIPIALLGKVYCRVDAQYAPVQVGDMLTSSPTPGHAMKVHDPLQAFGSVIGKALRPLAAGRDLVPILIALQ